MVASFSDSPPNQILMAFADGERARGARRVLDVGCGAGRNLVPLARKGWKILGVDLSAPMVAAAGRRLRDGGLTDRASLALAPMDALPVADASVDLVIAHGIWNLAGSDAEFRAGIREAARVARTGAALFVFTFSRFTLPTSEEPVAGESYTFTGFSGRPQIFLTADDLIAELAAAGFELDPAVPLRQHNLPKPGMLRAASVPVILEGAFRRTSGSL